VSCVQVDAAVSPSVGMRSPLATGLGLQLRPSSRGSGMKLNSPAFKKPAWFFGSGPEDELGAAAGGGSGPLPGGSADAGRLPSRGGMGGGGGVEGLGGDAGTGWFRAGGDDDDDADNGGGGGGGGAGSPGGGKRGGGRGGGGVAGGVDGDGDGDGDDGDGDGAVDGFADGGEGGKGAAARGAALRKRMAAKAKGLMALAGKRKGGAAGAGGGGGVAGAEGDTGLDPLLAEERERDRRKRLGQLMNWGELTKLEVRLGVGLPGWYVCGMCVDSKCMPPPLPVTHTRPPPPHHPLSPPPPPPSPPTILRSLSAPRPPPLLYCAFERVLAYVVAHAAAGVVHCPLRGMPQKLQRFRERFKVPLKWRQILMEGDPDEVSDVKVSPLHKVQAMIWQVRVGWRRWGGGGRPARVCDPDVFVCVREGWRRGQLSVREV
jgi:hypothetical protein